MSSVRRQILRYAIGLLLGSGGLFWYAYREWQGRQGATASPEPISLDQLSARGPEGNPHILLSHFIPCSNYAAFPAKGGNGWGAVYVPLIPGKLPAYNEPLPHSNDKIEVLLLSTSITEQRDLRLLRNPSGLRGLVANNIDPLGSKHRDFLQEQYPGIDLSRCVIVQEGRAPADEFEIQLAAGLGGVLLLGSLLLLGWAALLGRHRPPAASAAPSIQLREGQL